MNDLRSRMEPCFKVVFPDLADGNIRTASQESVAAWDSIATITLLQVLEDEFSVEFDLERIAEFNSFEAIHSYLAGRLPSAA
jgi:acyl carrier protein